MALISMFYIPPFTMNDMTMGICIKQVAHALDNLFEFMLNKERTRTDIEETIR